MTDVTVWGKRPDPDRDMAVQVCSIVVGYRLARQYIRALQRYWPVSSGTWLCLYNTVNCSYTPV
jgi:hypothetical protein